MTIYSLLNISQKISYSVFIRSLCLLRISKTALIYRQSLIFTKMLSSRLFRSCILASVLIKYSISEFRALCIKLKTKRGMRYIFGLPVNGQRSKTNGRTQKRVNN